MRRTILIALFIAPLQSACTQDKPEEAAAAEAPAAMVEATDEEILAAAGFTQADGRWSKCGDPGTASYTAGEVVERGDYNGDGRADAMVYEGSTFCFGMTGQGYTLLSQQTDGTWTIMDERGGIPEFLGTRGADGWPDIEVGGPGFCFPVIRWNGSEFALDRSEYEGKACQG